MNLQPVVWPVRNDHFFLRVGMINPLLEGPLRLPRNRTVNLKSVIFYTRHNLFFLHVGGGYTKRPERTFWERIEPTRRMFLEMRNLIESTLWASRSAGALSPARTWH